MGVTDTDEQLIDVHAHFLTSNGMVATASGFHPLVVSARGSDVHNSVRHPARRALIRFVLQRADPLR